MWFFGALGSSWYPPPAPPPSIPTAHGGGWRVEGGDAVLWEDRQQATCFYSVGQSQMTCPLIRHLNI